MIQLPTCGDHHGCDRTPVTKLMCNNIKYFHETNRLSSQTIIKYLTGRVRVMVFNVTINNISAHVSNDIFNTAYVEETL
jgi:hypothetical protein